MLIMSQFFKKQKMIKLGFKQKESNVTIRYSDGRIQWATDKACQGHHV